jgi:hypothetical protein
VALTEKRKPDLGPSGEWYIVKSEPRGAYVIVKPAITPANDRIACAVAGSAGGEVKCLPLTPSATTKATSTGNQMTRSNHMSTVYPQNETCGESKGGSRDDHTQEELTTRDMMATTTIPTLSACVSDVPIRFYFDKCHPPPAQVSVRYTSQRLASQDGVQDTKSAHANEVEDAGHDHAIEPS